MLRYLIIMVPCVMAAGCYTNPFGNCGTRVPPPSTGSYGAPNTYYQNVVPQNVVPQSVVPRSSAVPGEGLRAVNSLGTWRSVGEAGESKVARASSATAPAGEVTGSSVRGGQVAASSPRTTPATIARSSASRLKLNGMPISEAKSSAVTPANYLAPITESEVEQENPAPQPAPKPTTKAPSKGIRTSPSPVRTDTWQSRSTPAPNRIVGN